MGLGNVTGGGGSPGAWTGCLKQEAEQGDPLLERADCLLGQGLTTPEGGGLGYRILVGVSKEGEPSFPMTSRYRICMQASQWPGGGRG